MRVGILGALVASPPDLNGGPLPSEMRLAIRGRNRMQTYELSALNAGIFFDVEADRVWRMLTDRALKANRLWLYEFRAG